MNKVIWNITKSIAGFAVVLGISLSAGAADSCRVIHSPYLNLINPRTAVRMLKHWEQSSNQERWGKPSTAVDIQYVEKDPAQLKVRTSEGISPELLAQFSQENFVRWYRHPLNESNTVPFLKDPASGVIPAHYSASRSMFVMVGKDLYSFKLGTDHPHPNGPKQAGKADLLNDSDISMRRSAHIRASDKILPKAKRLYVLTEVLSVATETNGFSVRDLRPLQDGHLYMPAFSVPYAGRKIAERLNVDFTELWGEAFAANLGAAKAELLMRYGLQMKTPNAQNWLIQLDKKLRPTGKIYMRDVADSNYVDFIAPFVGAQIQMIADKKSSYTIMTSLEPFWENSVWQMDEGGVTPAQSRQWGQAHDQAYIATICEYLGITNRFQDIASLQRYLKSAEGQAVLFQYLEAQSTRYLDKAG
jgi:hypothetical protein